MLIGYGKNHELIKAMLKNEESKDTDICLMCGQEIPKSKPVIFTLKRLVSKG